MELLQTLGVSSDMTLKDDKGNLYTGKPYVDFKTFGGWLKDGRAVKKGEKSLYTGISFMKGTEKENPEKVVSFPKSYYLFHFSQTQECKRRKK